MGKDGVLVDEERIFLEAFQLFHRSSEDDIAKRNLKSHINYIQDVYMHANMLGHQLTMKLGLNPRHLLEGTEGMGHPMDAVVNNMMVMKREKSRRQLVSTGTSPTLNWCTTNNPKGKSVCGDVKSQQSCGSCWAFAATDVIETAVALATGNPPVSLSSQQLLSCSTSKEIRTYEYCFAGTGSVPSWLQTTMKWDSVNDGCNGGMTHIALDDAALRIGNLASRIDWPYKDATTTTNSSAPVGPSGNRRLATNSTLGSSQYNVCGIVRPASLTAAHISGWEPALNASSCSETKDPAILLKKALASGPLAVALTAEGSFKSYTSGVYTCPTITSSNMLNHAVLLVGYDTGSEGDYWILKNSYGSMWGMSGFINIKTDSIINCGLNVFPIRALGASAGPAANVTVDGGGTLTFGGVSMGAWIAISCVVSVLTLVLTIAVECTDANGCLWMGKHGVLVGERHILQEALLRFHRTNDFATAKRNLKAHIDYIQDVYMHANMLGHQLTMKLGLNPRHLLEGTEGMGHPMDAVVNNMMVMKREKSRRQLVSTGTSPTLNWCTTNNPKGKSVCGVVKNQELCGSCWAFAATDVIETAVALATGNNPVSLSSQQLLSCSTSKKEIRTYEYCFAGTGSVPSWLQSTVKWNSSNDGCNGGMTHTALNDAAVRIGNLASHIDWPYTNAKTTTNSSAPVGPSGNRRLATNSTFDASQYNTCNSTRPASLTAAHISGWEPALNASSCSETKDPALLLKQALASGPLAVALCANCTNLKYYKSGVNTCDPISTPKMIDHALLLVGYDTDESKGDYWILKNSYGVSWGLSGFFHLKTDSIINCGLN
ncbi:cysteine protease family C01A, partial [Thraustotheca clavata]